MPVPWLTYGLDGHLLGAPHRIRPFFNISITRSTNSTPPSGRPHFSQCAAHPHPEPLAVQLADLPARFAPWRMVELRLHKRITYDVRAN